ncbi:ABC transporter permease [Agrococcus carbonis]|uniref:Peptide/nickel transport system permease protein n=1 Tax=Agrococcus carbonis TaxID=684552 RepID=A0A1H1LK35_9MICO|nr:ABC transporter permease [Agrococcus carbonis]SDR74878.1 peptide/nickel transport system permease protein [Agrococcus carbonis]
MLSFIVRRILASILTLIVASYIMYILTAYSGNPLEDLQASNAPNAQLLIGQRIERLDLDVPPPLRWFGWAAGAVGCLVPFGPCDLGTDLNYTPVTQLLPNAAASTVRLVAASTILAILFGIITGIVSALRQYSAFDLGMTFVSFLLYSLPSFLAAVLLKEFVAIGFNNWLASGDSSIGVIPTLIVALVVGVIMQALVAGSTRGRLVSFALSAAATFGLISLLDAIDWFQQPGLGPIGLLILIGGVVAGVVAVLAGFGNRRALLGAGIAGVLAYAAFFALQGLFAVSTIWTIMILGLATLAVCFVIGWVIGGPDRSQVIRVTMLVGFLSGLLVVADRYLQAWPGYLSHPRINNRPIATVGEQTVGLSGDMWLMGLDMFTHFLLPTISLTLISFAGYTRYARAGLLEVMNQDYIRTARAKGLSERVVVTRHAFRNMLIPITTIVAADIGVLLGGALITERVFAISGMGALFNVSLDRVDVNPVMGYFLVIAITAILFNFLADLSYALLDPRVRVK